MGVTEAANLARIRQMITSGDARRVRRRHGLSLVEAADAIGTTATSLSRWELRRCRPRAKAALRYARLLSELIALDESEARNAVDLTQDA